MEDWIDHDETIFENKFEYTQPLLKELYKGMLKWDKRRRMNMIFIYVLLGINIAMCIVFTVMGNFDIFKLLIISLALLAAVVIFRALEPVILSRSVMKNYQKRYNEPMDVYTTFDEDYMTTHDVSLGATAQKSISYESISSVHESENFIVLRLDKRQVMSILKTGFIKGNLDDFRTFIMRKIHEAEAGYENVDIDTGDVEEDREEKPVYTAPQDVADVYPDGSEVAGEGVAGDHAGSPLQEQAEEDFVAGAGADNFAVNEADHVAAGTFAEESTAAQDVADVYPDEEAVGESADLAGGASTGSATPRDTFTQEVAGSSGAEEFLDADYAEEEADPYKAIDAFRKKD